MLAITVDTLVDEADGSIGDGDVSLRDAIAAATPNDTIDFSVTGTIELNLGELVIARSLTITGPGASELTIDARGASRVLDINDGDSNVQSDVKISGLTLTGGSVAGNGGAIRSVENVTITDSTISGNTANNGGGISNRTRGGTTTIANSTISGNSAAFGGGVYTSTSDGGVTTITSSTISGNSVTGAVFGGGVFAFTSSGASTTISNSIIADNASVSPADRGGGIFAYTSLTGRVTIADTTVSGGNADSGGGIVATTTSDGVLSILGSTISGNHTNAYGGGITAYTYFGGSVTITGSTIVTNSTNGWGGGIDARTYSGANVTIDGSTISGNSAGAEGGGLRARSGSLGAVDIQGSTVSGNVAPTGGGLFNFSGMMNLAHSTVTLNSASAALGSGVATRGTGGAITSVKSSIVAGNTNSDLDAVGGGDDAFSSLGYNLIGDGNRVALFNSNDQTNVALPMLGLLAHNGGPTMTHAPLNGSPAIDMGNPEFLSLPSLDQRGYYRVVDGNSDTTPRIDVGALEFGSAAVLAGDGNLDGTVDANDYDVWLIHFGDNPALDPFGTPKNGDYNGDSKVDGLDYLVWAGNYGASLSTMLAAARASQSLTAYTSDQLVAIDAALEDEHDIGATAANDLAGQSWRTSSAFDAALVKLSGRRRDHKRVRATI